MENDMTCEVCGALLSEHEINDREAPTDRPYGIFEGEEWRGVLCPED